MGKRILSLSGMLTAVVFGALGLSSTTVWAQTIAYNATVQPGNQAWSAGSLGLDFNVNSPIIVSSLGAFDSNGDGFAGTVSVAIYSRTTMAQVAGPLSFHLKNGTLVNGDRFLKLSPAAKLPAGQYSIVAYGFSASDMNGNSTQPPPYTASTENTGGGAISFVGTGRYDMNGSLDYPTIVPSGTPTNVFLAGTFEYGPTPADTFTTGADYSADSFPTAIATGNFKGAHLDLAVVNSRSNDVSILLGNGDGTFTAASPENNSVGRMPHSVAVGDFNGDGVSDLAVANSGDNTVSILIGKGGGKFKAAVPFPAGTTPYQVAVADFNKDGFQDLVVVNDNLAVSVLLGDGTGNFGPPITDADPLIAPASQVVADFNNDGIPDVAVANADLGTVSVLIGNGDGTFQAARVLTATFPEPFFITSGDFNNDGNADLAFTDYSGFVYVWLGNGSGSFPGSATGYVVGEVPNWLSVGDINGDGILDLMVANSYSSNVNVLVGNGKGIFNNVASYTTPTMWIPAAIGLGIFDESGKREDAAVVDFYAPVHILLGQEDTISVTSGNFQIDASASSTYPMPLVVTVSGAAATGPIPVTFTAPSTPGVPSVTFAGGATSVLVMTNGGVPNVATSPAFKGNGIVGTVTITASVGYAAPTDTTGTVQFSERN